MVPITYTTPHAGGNGMASQMTEEQIYEEAKLRVKKRRSFWNHFAAWAVVNIILIVIWALTYEAGEEFWFLWPLCIWGAFVLLHGLRVFIFERKSDRSAIEKEIENIRREQG
jgi:dolichol kinase